VRVLGNEPGRASAMKMVLSGVSKGVCALFLELALVARRQGMLAEMLDASAGIYPGIASLVDRMLPTYSRHAGRRAEEMNELAATARAAGVEPCVIDAVRRLHEALAGVAFDAPPGNGWCEWTAASLAEHVAGQGFLAAASTAARVGTAGEGAGGRRE
jgi:3-hydroxyisobutyrate dehydrogenase-like beta-hydroxyacid dehydrogenase